MFCQAVAAAAGLAVLYWAARKVYRRWGGGGGGGGAAGEAFTALPEQSDHHAARGGRGPRIDGDTETGRRGRRRGPGHIELAQIAPLPLSATEAEAAASADGAVDDEEEVVVDFAVVNPLRPPLPVVALPPTAPMRPGAAARV